MRARARVRVRVRVRVRAVARARVRVSAPPLDLGLRGTSSKPPWDPNGALTDDLVRGRVDLVRGRVDRRPG